MKTFLKLVALALVIVVAAHFWPLALFPLGLIGIAVLLVGGFTAGALAIVLAVGAVLVAAILAVALTAAAATSPIWVFALIVIGIISLCRRAAGRTA